MHLSIDGCAKQPLNASGGLSCDFSQIHPVSVAYSQREGGGVHAKTPKSWYHNILVTLVATAQVEEGSGKHLQE